MNALEVSHQLDAHVGARIAMRRMALGLTREAIAQALNVTVRQVEAYETGSARVGAGMLFELADLFDVKVAYFFETDRFQPSQRSAPGAFHELNQAS